MTVVVIFFSFGTLKSEVVCSFQSAGMEMLHYQKCVFWDFFLSLVFFGKRGCIFFPWKVKLYKNVCKHLEKCIPHNLVGIEVCNTSSSCSPLNSSKLLVQGMWNSCFVLSFYELQEWEQNAGFFLRMVIYSMMISSVRRDGCFYVAVKKLHDLSHVLNRLLNVSSYPQMSHWLQWIPVHYCTKMDLFSIIKSELMNGILMQLISDVHC